MARYRAGSDVLDGGAADEDLGELPEALAVARGANGLLKVHVHPRVDGNEVAVECLAVAELNELRSEASE